MYPNYLEYTTVFISLLHEAKHKQLRERLKMSSEFTKEEDYREVRQAEETQYQATLPSQSCTVEISEKAVLQVPTAKHQQKSGRRAKR
jgi:hypothetical protein